MRALPQLRQVVNFMCTPSDRLSKHKFVLVADFVELEQFRDQARKETDL